MISLYRGTQSYKCFWTVLKSSGYTQMVGRQVKTICKNNNKIPPLNLNFFKMHLTPQLLHCKTYPFHPASCLLLSKHNNVGILIIHVLVLLSFLSSQAQPQLRLRPWTKRWLSLHTNCLDVLFGFSSETTPLEGLMEHSSSTARCCMELFCFAASPAHCCWLTQRWVTRIPLLEQGLPGAEAGRGAMPRAALVLSTAALSPPDQTCICRSDCHFPGLLATWDFLMQFISFLPPQELSGFLFDSHHLSTQLTCLW